MPSLQWHDAAVFFREEYELDYLVATLKKPHVALVNGVVMGGGNGISMLGSFRVVTEKVVRGDDGTPMCRAKCIRLYVLWCRSTA